MAERSKENIEILKRAVANVKVGGHGHCTPSEIVEPFF